MVPRGSPTLAARTVPVIEPHDSREKIVRVFDAGVSRSNCRGWQTVNEEKLDQGLTAQRFRPKADGCWKPKTGEIRVIPIRPKAKSVLERMGRDGSGIQFLPGSEQISERRLLDYRKRVLSG